MSTYSLKRFNCNRK